MILRTATHFLGCFVQPLSLVFLVFLVFCLRAAAQDRVADQIANYPFLLRLEHTTKGSRACVLLRRNGEFHFEHTRGDETEVSEGQIPDAELVNLKEALNSDQLQQISQQKIIPPLLDTTVDQVQVNVVRTDHWQNLYFADSTSQIPYSGALKPLLTWMRALQDEPHRTLTEDEGKNNCLTPKKLHLTIRTNDPSLSAEKKITENAANSAANGAAGPQSSQPKSFLMRYSLDHFSSGVLQRTCVIVNPTGSFRMEKGSQQVTFKMKASVFEGSISEDELRELNQLLEAPDLKNLHHQNRLASVRRGDVQITSLSIPREKEIQQLLFSSYIGDLSGRGDPGDVIDDTSSIQPLQKWLRASIADKKLAPVKSTKPNSCAPGP
jgi:hypothetical protein